MKRILFCIFFLSPILIGATVISVAQKTNQEELVINFISIGAGIDHRAKESLDAFLKKFGAENNVRMDYQQEIMGREGEVRYTFNLGKIDKKRKMEFLNEVKKIVKGSKLVTLNK